MKNLFRFDFTKETAVAFAAGAVMIALSLLMLPFMGASLFDKIASIVLRDLLMIFGLGVVFVSLYVERNKDGVKAIGFTGKRNVLSLLLNILFAAGLLAMFLKEGRPQGILEVRNLYAAAYILVAGVFEMAFGIVPAILLTAAFYSFHHAGFQPEFMHLFFVGLMYSAVYYITQNLLIVFPFFWAAGALWDVIVSSEAGNEIKNFESFAIALAILALSAIWIFVVRRKRDAV